MIEIREEHTEDVAAIRDVNKRAFGQEQEGNIVDALRSNGAALLSLVATVNGRVVGHIMYSQLTVGDVTGAALGPMALCPTTRSAPQKRLSRPKLSRSSSLSRQATRRCL